MFPTQVLQKQEDLENYVRQRGLSQEQIRDSVNLLLQTCIHKSFSADFKNPLPHNERIEFLGDSILGAMITKHLYTDYPQYSEADLTLYKIALVREETLAEVARDIGLDTKIFVSKGEEKMAGRTKNAILADCLEALIGYLYTIGGEKIAENFIIEHIYKKLSSISIEPTKSYKTLIQEEVQKEYKQLPVYNDIPLLTDEKGNVLTYESHLIIVGKDMAQGTGPSKKRAQEEAAKNYYGKKEGNLYTP